MGEGALRLETIQKKFTKGMTKSCLYQLKDPPNADDTATHGAFRAAKRHFQVVFVGSSFLESSGERWSPSVM